MTTKKTSKIPNGKSLIMSLQKHAEENSRDIHHRTKNVMYKSSKGK
jgi:hypothetical protein